MRKYYSHKSKQGRILSKRYPKNLWKFGPSRKQRKHQQNQTIQAFVKQKRLNLGKNSKLSIALEGPYFHFQLRLKTNSLTIMAVWKPADSQPLEILSWGSLETLKKSPFPENCHFLMTCLAYSWTPIHKACLYLTSFRACSVRDLSSWGHSQKEFTTI